ncbi:VOC family protein [Lysinibacillus sp. KU-BSD001]|uniref:VOC family protein n=1 Tax=Lysinibacillus sp. KU-BSD001 TaxID=3141328 RepID=UPI0036EDBD27
MKSIHPFLMFKGDASQVIDTYASWFTDFEVISKQLIPQTELIALAEICIHGQRILLNDTQQQHAFDFTPSFSFFIECESEQEVHALAEKMNDGGQALMPLGQYGFSTLFGWYQDRFGVSWQINFNE